MLPYRIFSYNLRRLIEKNKLDQAVLCFALNFDHRTVSNWTRARALPSPESMVRLATVLHCEIYDFWERVPEGELTATIPDGRNLRKLKNEARRKLEERLKPRRGRPPKWRVRLREEADSQVASETAC